MASAWKGGLFAHYAQSFDRHLGKSPSIVGSVIASVVSSLIVFAIFKGLVYLYAKLFSLFQKKDAPHLTASV